MILLFSFPDSPAIPASGTPKDLMRMTRRAIWATSAGLLIGLLTASAARADPAAIIGHLKAAASRRLSNATARQKQ